MLIFVNSDIDRIFKVSWSDFFVADHSAIVVVEFVLKSDQG